MLVDDDINGAVESEHMVRPVIAKEIDSSVPMLEVRDQLRPQSSDVSYRHPNPKLFGMVSGNDMGQELRKQCDKDDLVGATVNIPDVVLNSGVAVGPRTHVAPLCVNDTQDIHKVLVGPSKSATWKKRAKSLGTSSNDISIMPRPGKRGLEAHVSFTGDNVEMLRLKKRLLNDESGEPMFTSMEAVEQPHQSQ